MKIINAIMKNNPCYTANEKITVKGLMLHSVGCNQPSAEVFVKNWNKPTYKRACVHAFIDGNTGDVYQTLPWEHRGWHGGGASNNTHIGVEMCEPASIRYSTGAKVTIRNEADAKAVATRTYNSAVELFAKLCEVYKLNPLEDGVIISHSEGNKRGIASAHVDPEHLWRQLGLPYTMDTFRNDVKNKMNKKVEDTNTNKDETNDNKKVIYRVQVGAFSVKSYAEAYVKKLKQAGFDAFITRTTL